MLIFQMLTYGLMILSVLIWQTEIIPYQILLEILIVSIITIFAFKTVVLSQRQMYPPVIFSLAGEWLETSVEAQTGWLVTDKSRISSLLLFIHLMSPVNSSHSKWRLIYKDQVTERDFRRLCCAVNYQQQNPRKID
jgi:hypothetical protein